MLLIRQKVIRFTTTKFDSFWEVQYSVWQEQVCHNLRKSIQTRHICVVLTHNTTDYRDAEKYRKYREKYTAWQTHKPEKKKRDRKKLQVQPRQEKFSRPLGALNGLAGFFTQLVRDQKHGACFWHCIVSVFALSFFKILCVYLFLLRLFASRSYVYLWCVFCGAFFLNPAHVVKLMKMFSRCDHVLSVCMHFLKLQRLCPFWPL